jgi:hypothetical protein
MRRLWLPEISISAPLPANDASRSETASKAICDAVCTSVIGITWPTESLPTLALRHLDQVPPGGLRQLIDVRLMNEHSF